MAYKGCDFAGGRPSPAALKAAGIAFVGRYLADAIGSQGAFKNLTAAEAQSYLAAGIAIMPIWEGTADEALTGHDNGYRHGQAWKAQAGRLGIPLSVVAWYTVDTGTSADISDYELGFAAGVDPYPIGIYADGFELAAAVKRGRVAKTWQTNATAWPGGVFSGANIVQWITDATGRRVFAAIIDGTQVDLNQADSLAGMWGAATIQSVPQPAPSAIVGGNVANQYGNGFVINVPVVADLNDPQVGGTWLLGKDGSIWAVGGARASLGAANGKDYFKGRTAAKLIPSSDSRYIIVASSGEPYGPSF